MKEVKVEATEEGVGNGEVVKLSMQVEHPEAKISVIGLEVGSEVDDFIRSVGVSHTCSN